ncbi:MAG: metal-dependent hydrolase [bacterium]|nr:metal-dependent hydrolase [bacterium]
MEVKYYGHSCFSVHIGGKTILFDPFISVNELAKNIDITAIKVDYIFLSHAHQDHMYDALEIAKNNNAKIVGIWEVSQWYNNQNYTNTHAMNLGGFWEFDFGKVQMVKAVHSSSFPDGTYGGNPAGFVISDGNKTFYYSGDTALTLDMQLIPLRHSIDFAFLSIGNNFTMDITDAITAASFIKCNHIIGMHYDTFGYIQINHEEAINQFNKSGKILTLMNIEQKLDL